MNKNFNTPDEILLVFVSEMFTDEKVVSQFG